ncbi:MAG: hypothetical protein ACK48N_08195 [Planctomyces sp.]
MLRPFQNLDALSLSPLVLVLIALLAIAVLVGCVSQSSEGRGPTLESESSSAAAASSEAAPALAPPTIGSSSPMGISALRTESARLSAMPVTSVVDSPMSGGESSLGASSLIRNRFMRLAQATGMFAEANKRLAAAITQFNPDQDKDVGNSNAGSKAALAAIEQFLSFANLALADFAAAGAVDVPGASNEQACLTELVARLEALRRSGLPTREQVAETLRWYCQCTGMATPTER